MDYDDYESLNEEFKIVDIQSQRLHFFTSSEMMNDATIPKEEVSSDEMIGDPSRVKSIKTSRPAVYDIHTATSSNSNKIRSRPREEVNYKVCPICSYPASASCNCANHDTICANNHKWHVKNGKIMLGHTH